MEVHFKLGRYTYEVHITHQELTGGGHCFYIHKIDHYANTAEEKFAEGWEHESEADALIAAYHAIKEDVQKERSC